VDAKRTILVVDDVPMFRELGSLFLSRYGRVLTAANGPETLDAVRREHPEVVVLDFHMPDVDSEVLCEEIRALSSSRRPPSIVAICNGDSADYERAIRAGAADVLSKPLSRVSLVETVNRFVRFPEVRGMARVAHAAAVRVMMDREERWGTMRNLSRGGMYIEANWLAPPEVEMRLEFRLPEVERPLSPTAKVIWSRRRWNGITAGMGVRFLALDAISAHTLDSFVYERFIPEADGFGFLRGAS
jgi:CheY-like chemotaxis protein